MAKVGIIMGSTSDLSIMEDAKKILDELKIDFSCDYSSCSYWRRHSCER
jgi:phosphoribosylcarboxyaminoimidazole (NCAIR) mutase